MNIKRYWIVFWAIMFAAMAGAAEAIRYARKLDGEREATGIDGDTDHRICEHMWCDGSHK